MTIFGSVAESKTKPKQTQTKPNCEMPKMNVSPIRSNDYNEITAFCRYRNKANSNPKQSQSFSPGQCPGSTVAGAATAKQFEKSQFLIFWNLPVLLHIVYCPFAPDRTGRSAPASI